MEKTTPPHAPPLSTYSQQSNFYFSGCGLKPAKGQLGGGKI